MTRKHIDYTGMIEALEKEIGPRQDWTIATLRSYRDKLSDVTEKVAKKQPNRKMRRTYQALGQKKIAPQYREWLDSLIADLERDVPEEAHGKPMSALVRDGYLTTGSDGTYRGLVLAIATQGFDAMPERQWPAADISSGLTRGLARIIHQRSG
jgi:hypothetical protein